MREEPARGTLDRGTAFICGSNGFVESASQLLLGAGYAGTGSGTERFGRTA
jgi:ferredoxin-NADP reductase